MFKCHKVKIYETTNFFCNVFGALIDAKPIDAQSWACAGRRREGPGGCGAQGAQVDPRARVPRHTQASQGRSRRWG